MGFYSNYNGYGQSNDTVLTESEQNELFNAFFYDEHYSLNDNEKKALLESDEVALLEKAKYLNKKTQVRLSKNDDLTRRTNMAALELAKKNKSPIWAKLVQNRIQERKLLAMAIKQYGVQAKAIAIKSQKDYISTLRNPHKIKVKDISNRE